VEAGIATLIAECESAYGALPWYGKDKPTSTKALANECRRVGIPPPPPPPKTIRRASMGSEVRTAVSVGGEHPPLAQGQPAPEVLQTMRERVRRDGTLPFSSSIFGAIHTGRWSGDAGFNIQNLNREPYWA
jgi:hypothetical protein